MHSIKGIIEIFWMEKFSRLGEGNIYIIRRYNLKMEKSSVVSLRLGCGVIILDAEESWRVQPLRFGGEGFSFEREREIA